MGKRGPRNKSWASLMSAQNVQEESKKPGKGSEDPSLSHHREWQRPSLRLVLMAKPGGQGLSPPHGTRMGMVRKQTARSGHRYQSRVLATINLSCSTQQFGSLGSWLGGKLECLLAPFARAAIAPSSNTA